MCICLWYICYKTVNLVNTSNGKILTDFSGTINVALGYVLVDCEDGICKQTQGYVLDNAKVIAFAGATVGVAAKGSDENKAIFSPDELIADTGCLDNAIGKVYDITGVCIYYENPSTKLGVNFSNTAGDPIKKYIINSSATGTTGTPFESDYDYLAIKSGLRYIIRDEFNSEGNFFLICYLYIYIYILYYLNRIIVYSVIIKK